MSELGSFWARRRAAVQAEAEADLRAAEEARAVERRAELAQKNDAEVLKEMGLPDPASLKAGDDFTGFMARDVPEHLRRQALRTLWRSNPVLACVDGLNEYDDDYRAAMLLQEPIKTAYQVGKGMLKHVEEMERKAQAEAVAEAEPEEEAPVEVITERAAPTETAPEQVAVLEAQDAVSEEAQPVPRVMRFRFEEATG